MQAASIIPLDVWLSACFGFVSVKDRWRHLALVSRAWRAAALASVKAQTHLDWVICKIRGAAANTSSSTRCVCVCAVHLLLRPIDADSATLVSAHMHVLQTTTIKLYGPRVTPSLLSTLLWGVSPTQLRGIAIESKQLDTDGLTLLALCTNLTSLSLNCIKLTDAVMVHIAKSCVALASVDVRGCSRLGDDTLVALSLHCPRLHTIDISMCIRVTDVGIHALALHPPTLVAITANKCLKVSDASLTHLLHAQPQLTHLSVANCPKLHDAFLLFGGSSRLQQVNLMGCASIHDSPAPPHVPLGGLSHFLCHHSASLTRLDLTGLVHLESHSFRHVAVCKHLVSLNLAMCRSLADDDVAAVAAGCPRLVDLSLQGCVHIGDPSLRALAAHCARLTTLSLVFCYNITDAGFCALVAGCLGLTHVNVKACNLLSQAAFVTLATRPSDVPLVKLVIGACADLTTTAMYASIVKRAFPACVVMWT
ncbi:Aste57867_12948 [Aphanomyces stellatus]|uniref:Aste57867_12948 protein n=1 Tax=Aphanomyces stellatus TaxID=120398 RepID=A0A485KWX7_9STRA|nr:hypothetical protein As57867_012900 [Aphanomyces stellatus]VFT89794.1 Aste57867_12948 [Aphanomyces stellatus]